MDPELKQLLEENLKVAQETNQMLKSMRTMSRWRLAGQAVLWILVFIIPLFFLSTYLGPIESLMNPSALGTTTGSYGDALQNLINQYKVQ